MNISAQTGTWTGHGWCLAEGLADFLLLLCSAPFTEPHKKKAIKNVSY